MGLNTYSGKFTILTSDFGAKAITGLGFTPKLLVFFASRGTGTGTTIHSKLFLGASTGPGNNYCGFSVKDQDNVSTTVAKRQYSTSHCIYVLATSGTGADYSALMQSFDADGFTIDVDDFPTADSDVCFLAIGGSDVQAVEVGGFNMSTGAVGTTQDVTMAGSFRPDGLILATASTSTTSETEVASLYATLGLTDGTNQFVSTCWSDDAQSDATYKRSLANDAILFSENDGAVINKFAFTSFLSTGFRLTVSSVATSAQKVMYIAIKGPKFFAGDFVAKTDTSDVTSESAACGFLPSALLIMSATRTSYGSSADLSMSIGATTGTEATRANTNVFAAMAGEDGVGTTDSNSTLNITHCAGQARTSGGTAGLNHLKSFDTNGFTLYQDEAGSSAIICPYLAIGASGVGETSENRAVGRGIMRGIGRGIM